MGEQDDKRVLIRLRDGDKEAFREVFESLYPLFYSFAKRLLRDADAAEDIVQNVFMRLWVGRERLDENRSLRNYLLVSVRNEIYCYLRAANNARRESDLYHIATLADNSVNSEADLDARELEQRVEQIVSSMPQRRQEVYLLSRREHLSNAEIANRLNLSIRTVEKHIELALTEIRKNLSVSILLLITLLW